MAKVLFITANPKDENQSFSMVAGKAFLETYQETNPADEIVTVDLFKEEIPNLDADVFSGWGKLSSGQQIDALSTEELAKINRLNEILDQFISADIKLFFDAYMKTKYPMSSIKCPKKRGKICTFRPRFSLIFHSKTIIWCG